MSLQIVVVDDDAAFRDALSRHFLAQGHSAVSFPSVERCLPHLARARVDLITLDLDMPGIDGMTLLAALHKKGHKLPILVISGRAPGDYRHSIRAMGAHFLAKPFHPNALSDAVARALGTASAEMSRSAPPVSGVQAAADKRASVRERLQKATLPTVDPRLASIQGMLIRPEAPSFEVLAESLGEDPRLVAAVLRMANSTEYRGTTPTKSLGAAMARLGAKEVVSIVLEVLVHGTFQVKERALRASLDSSWKQSVECAHVARKLASLTGHIDPEEAYVYGLLHDIGRLAVYACLDGLRLEADQVQKYVDQYHEAVGARLLGEWGMPRTLVALAREHHESSRMTDEAALIALAHEVGTEEGVTTPELMEQLGITLERVEALVA
ncbi:MAG: putative nucleotidyltransferase with HDIG domain [Polyangiales bacterium]